MDDDYVPCGPKLRRLMPVFNGRLRWLTDETSTSPSAVLVAAKGNEYAIVDEDGRFYRHDDDGLGAETVGRFRPTEIYAEDVETLSALRKAGFQSVEILAEKKSSYRSRCTTKGIRISKVSPEPCIYCRRTDCPIFRLGVRLEDRKRKSTTTAAATTATTTDTTTTTTTTTNTIHDRLTWSSNVKKSSRGEETRSEESDGATAFLDFLTRMTEVMSKEEEEEEEVKDDDNNEPRSDDRAEGLPPSDQETGNDSDDDELEYEDYLPTEKVERTDTSDEETESEEDSSKETSSSDDDSEDESQDRSSIDSSGIGGSSSSSSSSNTSDDEYCIWNARS